MQVVGYKIMDALDALKEKAQTLDSGFIKSVYTFKDEPRPSPTQMMSEYEQVESKIIRLQELQSAYNLAVTLDFEGERISLERAVKLLGLMNRLKKQWQAAADLEPGTGMPKFGYFSPEGGNDFTRSKEVEVATRQVSREQARELADRYASFALKLKQLIRSGNAQPVELDADPSIFELA